MRSLQTYSDYRPTQFDTLGLGDVPEDWLVAPVILTRDSDALEESNYITLQSWLVTQGASAEDWRECHFGHWACGWFDIMVVRPGSLAATICGRTKTKLENYPALDELDWSNRQVEKGELDE